MEEPIICSCPMKTDLINSADVFLFFNENYPLPSIIDNLKKLSPKDLRCTCCLLATALTVLSQKKTVLGWTKLR